MMQELKSLDKSDIQEIVASDVWVSLRFAGTRLRLEVLNKDKFFEITKASGEEITKIDMLVSDLYSSPVESLNMVRRRLPDVSCEVVFNPKTENISGEGIFDNGLVALDGSVRLVTSKTYHTLLSPEIQKALLLKHSRVAFDLLTPIDVNSLDVMSIIITSAGPGKKIKIRNHEIKTTKSVPTDIYSLVTIDVIKCIKPESIRSKMITIGDTPAETYVNVISQLFLDYLQESKFRLDNLDYGFPAYMKVHVPGKLELLNEEIRAIISETPRLYDTFVMMLLLFTKEKVKSNPYIVDSTTIKRDNIYSIIQDICRNGVMELSLPSYDEFIGVDK